MNFYEKHVLPHEWLASWNITACNAGAVGRALLRHRAGQWPRADQRLAIFAATATARISRPRRRPARTDSAVDYTAGYVLVNGGGNIAKHRVFR